MGFLNIFRGRAARQPMQITGHIADTPQIVAEHDERYMTFYLAEAGETEFRLKMFPTTPVRRKGDRVVVMCASNDGATVLVQALYAAPDASGGRTRNTESLPHGSAEDGGGRSRGTA